MKKIAIVLLALVMLFSGFAGGFLIGERKADSYDSYDVVYKSFDSLSSTEKIKYFESIQLADTSPTQMKYVLKKLIADNSIDNDVKNNLFAYYLNHIQYYMSTYSGFVNLYEHIMMNNRDSIDYTSPTAADYVDDKVLKTVISEIYTSDMMIKVPPAYSSSGGIYVVVDYDKLEEEFGKMYNDATKGYIAFKVIAQNGELSNPDGSYSKEKLGDYMLMASDYIFEYDSYPLLADIINSYVLAAKMYCDLYDVSAAFYVSEDNAKLYKEFIENNPTEPVTPILNELVSRFENGKEVTYDEATQWASELDSLLGTSE